RPAQRRQGLCKVMKTCALVLAMLFIDSAHEHLTFVGGGCNPFQPPTRFDARLPTRLKAQVRNASPQQRRILPPVGDSADVQKHVFISLTDYDKKIDKLVEGDEKVVFIRGGVATGKTTLAEHLAREFPEKYVNVPPTDECSEQAWKSRLDQKSIQFFMRFCGGHRGIFIAAMHWVQSKQSKQSKQRSGKGWDFRQTVGFVRNSYNGGDWDCASNEILGYLQKSRAVRVNGLYEDVSNVPREFVELLCKGSTTLPHHLRRELTIYGFVLPIYSGTEGEFQQLDWRSEGTEYRAANPLLASYYFHNLKKRHSLQVQFERGKPQHCADLLMRALPYLLFSQVVSFEGNTSELAKDGLPGEEQYNQAICTVLKDMGFQPVSTKRSRKGEGNPDIALEIGGERFVLEGVKLNGNITEHLQRFDSKTNYKNAKHKALYIIGNDSERMLDKVKKTTADDVQVIGLVPNIAHTGYTVHVKSKGIKSTNKFTVDCDLVARRLVLKDDGKPELHSVQSLKSINLPPKAAVPPRNHPLRCGSVSWEALPGPYQQL
ncbi:unnamed protein product, partial [Effrenium voratum]